MKTTTTPLKIALTAVLAGGLTLATASITHADGWRGGKHGHGGYGMQSMDTDGDGAISRDEFNAKMQERMDKMFGYLDDNNDGVINADEMKSKRHKGKKRGKYGKHGGKNCDHGDDDGKNKS